MMVNFSDLFTEKEADFTTIIIKILKKEVKKNGYVFKSAKEWADFLNQELNGKVFSPIGFGKFVKRNANLLSKHFNIVHQKRKEGNFWLIAFKE
ncbi:hypothetical protein [Persephonella sp.]